MARKDRAQRQIDHKADIEIGGGEVITEAVSVASTALHVPSGPESLTVASQIIGRSASTPFIIVNLEWIHPDGEIPQDYLVSYAEDSAFTINETRLIAYNTTAAISVKPATTYYVRVAARLSGLVSAWSDTLSVVTIADTQVPDDVTSVAASFTNSNLIITWVEPADEAYKDAKIDIYNASRTILYETYYRRGGSFVWTAQENLRLTSGVGVTSVSVDVTSHSWGNVLGTPVTVTASQANPSTPTNVTHTWVNDPGLYDEHVTFKWDSVQNASLYTLTLDGIAHDLAHNHYEYLYPNNIAEHIATLASGDPIVSYSLVAKTLLNQSSTAATGNAINNAPPSNIINMQVLPGFSSIGAIITLASGVLDFDHYEYVLSSGATTINSFTSPDSIVVVDVSAPGTYDLSVRAVDKFGQRSNPVVSSGNIIDALTITELRAETQYSDSVGTSPTTLAGLKDGDLTTNVVTYAAGSSFKWTQAVRPSFDRYRTITYSISGTSVSTYFALSTDGVTWRWFAGPLVFTGGTGQVTTLVEYATEVDAADVTHAIQLNTGTHRLDLPVLIEARYVRVYHKHATLTYSFREYYPRRLVQSDDMEAETIKGINILAGTIQASHITVSTLAAIQTSTGTLVINTAGYLRSGMTAYDTGTGFYLGNDGGTPKFSLGNSAGMKLLWDGSNLSFRTASNNQRMQIDANGLRGYDNSNVLQVEVSSSNGKLLAGAGNVVLDSNGQTIYGLGTLEFSNTPGDSVRGTIGFNGTQLEISTPSDDIYIYSNGTLTLRSASNLVRIANNNTLEATGDVTIFRGSSGGTVGAYVKNTGGSASGTLSRFSVGQTNSESVGLLVQFDHNTDTATILNRKATTGTLEIQTTGGGIVIDNSGNTKMTAKVGFNNTTPITKPTVTGSRGGNAALASLLTALANYGLITDSSS